MRPALRSIPFPRARLWSVCRTLSIRQPLTCCLCLECCLFEQFYVGGIVSSGTNHPVSGSTRSGSSVLGTEQQFAPLSGLDGPSLQSHTLMHRLTVRGHHLPPSVWLWVKLPCTSVGKPCPRPDFLFLGWITGSGIVWCYGKCLISLKKLSSIFQSRCTILCSHQCFRSFYLFIYLFFGCIYWLCYYSCPISTPSFNSILPTPSLPQSPPIVHVHGSYLDVLWLLHFLHYSYPPPVYFPPIIYAIYSLYLSPPLPLPLPCW